MTDFASLTTAAQERLRTAASELEEMLRTVAWGAEDLKEMPDLPVPGAPEAAALETAARTIIPPRIDEIIGTVREGLAHLLALKSSVKPLKQEKPSCPAPTSTGRRRVTFGPPPATS